MHPPDEGTIDALRGKLTSLARRIKFCRERYIACSRAEYISLVRSPAFPFPKRRFSRKKRLFFIFQKSLFLRITLSASKIQVFHCRISRATPGRREIRDSPPHRNAECQNDFQRNLPDKGTWFPPFSTKLKARWTKLIIEWTSCTTKKTLTFANTWKKA